MTKIARRSGPLTTKDAVEKVQGRFGSVEELAAALIEHCPGYLEGEVGLTEAAKALDLPPPVLGKVISNGDFNTALDRLAAFQEYSYQHRRAAMGNLSRVATDPEKTVMTRSGEPAKVDRDADEMIKADSHLRKVQGRPLESGGGGTSLGLQVVFGGTGDAQTVTITGGEVKDGEAEQPYTPNRRGDPPPEGARRFYREERPGDEGHDPRLPREFDFERDPDTDETEIGPMATGEAVGEPTRRDPLDEDDMIEVPPGAGSAPGRKFPKLPSQKRMEEEREKQGKP